jgi:hypothetical protein
MTGKSSVSYKYVNCKGIKETWSHNSHAITSYLFTCHFYTYLTSVYQTTCFRCMQPSSGSMCLYVKKTSIPHLGWAIKTYRVYKGLEKSIL